MVEEKQKTPSVVVEIPLDLTISQQNFFDKTINVVNSAYNEALSYGLKRIKNLRNNPSFWTLLKERRALDSEDKEGKKKINQKLKDLQNEYSLSWTSLNQYMSTKRNEDGSVYKRLNSAEFQVPVKTAWKVISKVMTFQIKLNKVQFRSKYETDRSFENQGNVSGTRITESDKPNIAYTITFHSAKGLQLEIPVKWISKQNQLVLAHATKIKYIRITRRNVRGTNHYYLQIICQGYPYSKLTLGKGTAGVDPGVSTMAVVTDSQNLLIDLVPKKTKRKLKAVKAKQRKIDRSHRLNQPEAYDEDGKIKRGVHLKDSKRAKKLKQQIKNIQRCLRIERRDQQNYWVNRIVEDTEHVQIEKFKAKSYQKRAKKGKTDEATGRQTRKKRFGSSILHAAPARFLSQLELKMTQYGGTVAIVNPYQVKPSQYNHIKQKNIKKKLKDRIFSLSKDYPNIQRDLYSAFIIKTSNLIEDKWIINQLQMEREFPKQYDYMQQCIQNLKNTPSRLDWYIR